MLSQSPECSVRPLSLGRAPLVGRGLCSSLLVLLALGTVQAGAATILVPGATSCTLDNAIAAANTDTAVGGCAAGSGNDTIELTANVKLTNDTANTIQSNITLDGKNLYLIDGDFSFRILLVESTGNLTVQNAIITKGVGADGGGGIDNFGILTVKNSTISDNTSSSTGTFGGGILNEIGATATIENTTISGNSATSGGGIYNSENATLTLINCTITANEGTVKGAAIYNGISNSVLNLSYNTIYGNINPTKLGKSAGVYIEKGTVNMYGNIISGNTLTNTNPSSPNGQDIWKQEGTVNGNYNLIGDNLKTTSQSIFQYAPATNDITATSNGNTPTAIANILKTPTFNGGNTETAALVAVSPAVDAIPTGGTPTCTAGTTKDQRGYVRANGNGYTTNPNLNCQAPDTAAVYGNQKCDIGAYEFIGKNVCTLETFTTGTKTRTEWTDVNKDVLCGVTPPPNAKYTIPITFTPISSTPALYNIVFKVRKIVMKTAVPQNYVITNDSNQPKRVGATISASGSFGPGVGGQALTQNFDIGLCSLSAFTFGVDIFADPSVKGVLSVGEKQVDEHSLSAGQLRFEVDVENDQIRILDEDEYNQISGGESDDLDPLPVVNMPGIINTVIDAGDDGYEPYPVNSYPVSSGKGLWRK